MFLNSEILESEKSVLGGILYSLEDTKQIYNTQE